jgi:hypothetical protein
VKGCGRRAHWLSAICYLLSAIGYWLLAIGYWLLAIGYLLFAIRGFRDRFPRDSIGSSSEEGDGLTRLVGDRDIVKA